MWIDPPGVERLDIVYGGAVHAVMVETQQLWHRHSMTILVRSTGSRTWARSSRLERAIGEKNQTDLLDRSREDVWNLALFLLLGNRMGWQWKEKGLSWRS